MFACLGKHRRLASVGAVLALTVASCMLFPIIPREDAEDASFVRQAVPILHGRKVRGYEETKLLSDIIQVSNRETVLRALMAQPEFVDHWSEVLVDDLHIAREGFQSQQACYGSPLQAGAPTGPLANAIASQTPQTAAPGGPSNMSDVVRSSLVLDNLYPIYRAHLYAHVNRPPLATDEIQSRDILGAQFGEIYLNRQMGCLVCHNSEFSRSGQSSGWNRTFPILGLFEKSLFGSSFGEPTRNAYAMFRSDSRSGPLTPWGLQSCGTFKTTTLQPDSVSAHFVQPQGNTFGVHGLQAILQAGYLDLKLNGLERTLPPAVQTTCAFCKANCQGTVLSVEQAANNATNAAQVKAIFSGPTCINCHGGAANLYFTTGTDWANDLIGIASSELPATETRVIPGNASGSYLIKKLTNAPGIVGSRMPLGQPALSTPQITLIRDWINSLPQLTACNTCSTVDCNQFAQEVKGDEAFAYLVGARIVNNVWDEVFGHTVTIANYFPRNFEQRQVLWNLTEYKFLPTDWSLRDLLVRIMTSDFFNRVPPVSTTHSTAYDLPPVFDPWIALDPRVPPVSDPGYNAAAHPENHQNAMSEAVYRYSARSLVSSVSRALDWPKPQRFPAGSYPNADLMRSIGLRFSDDQPGFQTVDFQGLLAWESVHGRCAKPVSGSTDWIDRLMSAIGTFNPATSGGPLTVEDIAVVVRDWLLGHGGIGTGAPQGLTQTERDALQAHFGVASLTDPLSSVVDLPGKLRSLCGMHLQSPQFQLAGIAPSGLGVKPRLRVCNTPDCSYLQMCQAIKPAVDAVLNDGSSTGPKRSLVCNADSVSVFSFRRPPDLVDLCPRGACGLIPKFVNKGCPILGLGGAPGGPGIGACPTRPPACDPRCSRIDCCGGPLPPDFRTGDMMVAWAEGGEVLVAERATILRSGAKVPETLKPGTRVGVGDLIGLPPGSRFALRTPDGKTLRTPEKGLPQDKEQRVAVMMITGESALQTRRPDVSPRSDPRDLIGRVHASPWAARGEGGALLTNERRRAFRYSAEELKVDRLKQRGLLPEQIKRSGSRGKQPAIERQ